MYKTLIVEDNDMFRHSLNEILHTRFPSMSIAEAADGKDALDKVAGLHPDLVFMDIKLPDENGLSLTRTIKADHRDTVVIIITAYDIPEYRQAALQSGASYFMAKGTLSGEEILSVVKQLVEDQLKPSRLH